jgi:hypothetical protein
MESMEELFTEENIKELPFDVLVKIQEKIGTKRLVTHQHWCIEPEPTA